MIIGINGKIGHGKDTLGQAIQLASTHKHISGAMLEMLTTRGYNVFDFIGCDWQIVKFADKLKEVASLITGIPREDFEDRKVKASFLGAQWDKARIYYRYDGVSFQEILPSLAAAEEFMIHGIGYDKSYEIIRTTVRQFMLDLGDATRAHVHPNVWVNTLFASYKKHQRGAGGQHTNGPSYYPDWIITDMRMPNEFEAVKERGGLCVRITRPDAEESGIQHATESALDNHEFDIEVTNSTIQALVETARDIIDRANGS